METGSETTDAKAKFALTWKLWKDKGHDPAEKLIVDSETFSVGILDYISLDNIVYPSDKTYKNYEQAFAAVGRAIDNSGS
jgi:hypothetical protein